MTSHSRRTRFRGRVAIVTGAASGIGEATAKSLASEGASVAVVDVDQQGGERVVSEIRDADGKATLVTADISKTEQVEHMIKRTEDTFGRLDIIFNNAIWYTVAPATDVIESEWDKILDIGLKALWLSAKFGIPVMRKTGGGVIINCGSVHSLVGFPGHTAYDTVKSGVLGLTKVIASDYGPDIRVNAVLPGAILTPLWDKFEVPQDVRDSFAKGTPMRCLGTAENIADAVLFLASDEASFITGTHLLVDGGLLAARAL